MFSPAPKLARTSLFLWIIHAKALEIVEWKAPTPDGSMILAGGVMLGQWNSLLPIPTPSFLLCENEGPFELKNQEDENCGAPAWPAVGSDTNGNFVHLIAPNTTSIKKFYLKMRDTLAVVSNSPSFYIIPNNETQTPTFSETVSPKNAPTPSADIEPTPLEAKPKRAYVIPVSSVGAVLVLSMTAYLLYRKRQTPDNETYSEKLDRWRRIKPSPKLPPPPIGSTDDMERWQEPAIPVPLFRSPEAPTEGEEHLQNTNHVNVDSWRRSLRAVEATTTSRRMSSRHRPPPSSFTGIPGRNSFGVATSESRPLAPSSSVKSLRQLASSGSAFQKRSFVFPPNVQRESGDADIALSEYQSSPARQE